MVRFMNLQLVIFLCSAYDPLRTFADVLPFQPRARPPTHVSRNASIRSTAKAHTQTFVLLLEAVTPDVQGFEGVRVLPHQRLRFREGHVIHLAGLSSGGKEGSIGIRWTTS